MEGERSQQKLRPFSNDWESEKNGNGQELHRPQSRRHWLKKMIEDD